MEVVVLLVALVGIALVVIPRLQRRRRPSAVKTRKSALKRGRGRSRVPAAAAGMTATTRLAPASSDVDGWDDDLGWEGVDSGAPQTREAWENWRATDSPLAVRPEPDVPAASEPELPSVERWRSKAEDTEWEDDDDGLGWEGERAPAAPAPEPTAWASAGDAPASFGGAALGRDWSRGADAPTREADAAPAFAAAASAATDVAPVAAPAPEVVRTIALEDDDWDPPVTQTWGAREDAPAKRSAAAGSGKPRKNKLHPVVLVAIYAAAGIGLVVLASTALLGGSTDPAPAAIEATPVAAKTPAATPVATATVDAAAIEAAAAEKAAAAKQAAAATVAAERKARIAFGRERASAQRAHRRKVADAQAAARKKAKEARDRETPAAAPAPAPPAATPVPTYVAPAQPAPSYKAPAAKPRSVCEFCIG